MSLYNNTAAALSKGGLMGAIRDGIGGIAGAASGKIGDVLGNGRLAKAIGDTAGGLANGYAWRLANKYIPIQYQRGLNVGFGALGDLAQGNFDDAGLRILDSGLLYDYLPGVTGVAAQARYWGTPTPLYGGITPFEAQRIYQTLQNERLARKNFWLLEINSNLQGDFSERFNLFATDVEFAPYTLSGDKKKVGGAVLDGVTGNEPVELRLTTMDDSRGTLKRWFENQHAAVAAQDGTVGVPNVYQVKISVVHAVTRGAFRDAYENIGLYRPANLDISLSRRESAMDEVTMTFTQLDTFMKP